MPHPQRRQASRDRRCGDRRCDITLESMSTIPPAYRYKMNKHDYNVRALSKLLRTSFKVPHSRREMTQREMVDIRFRAMGIPKLEVGVWYAFGVNAYLPKSAHWLLTELEDQTYQYVGVLKHGDRQAYQFSDGNHNYAFIVDRRTQGGFYLKVLPYGVDRARFDQDFDRLCNFPEDREGGHPENPEFPACLAVRPPVRDHTRSNESYVSQRYR